jgi:hypothetical protein
VLAAEKVEQLPHPVFGVQKQAWAQLVRECALSAGRKESNIKVYLGQAVLNRQLVALGPAALTDILQFIARATFGASDLSVVERERVGALLQAARGRLDDKDSGSKAALSAVDQIYGRRAPLAAATCPSAVAIKRENTDADASSAQKRSADADEVPADGPSAGKRRRLTGLAPTPVIGDGSGER